MSSGNEIIAGVDVGSRSTKVVILRKMLQAGCQSSVVDSLQALPSHPEYEILARSLVPTGWTPQTAIAQAFQQALDQAGLQSVSRVIATGYGRLLVDFVDRRITEITAHARGAADLLPGMRTVIDIGGQDSKAIIISDGLVEDFAMNDRCAAGSGKFLEYLAMTMNLTVEEFAELAYRSNNPTNISSICTVFAESEVLSLLAEGVAREDVAAGAHKAIAWRVAQLALPLHPQTPVAFSGGVARNRCLVRELSQALKCEILVPPYPEFTGALGAALIGF